MPTPPPTPVDVGLDVAARTLAVVLAPAALPVPAAITVDNTAAGWQVLQQRVAAVGGTPATTRVILEATGTYWQGVALTLHQAGWQVQVVSPASVRHFADARRRRAKTDAVDAALLVDYLRTLAPAPWHPPAPAVQALQLLVRQRDDLVALRTQTRNRQHALAQVPQVPGTVQQQVAQLLTVLDTQISEVTAAIRAQVAATLPLATAVTRLQTIPGVGLLTAAVVVAETRLLEAGATAAQVVAFAGLDPAPRQSGTSVRGAGHVSKTGNARVRQAVYMAAVTAARCNPVLRAFYERLRAAGKRPRVALVAVARKLLVLMVTLLRHGRDFDPAWHAHHARHP